jgi:hypothetical protein
MELATVIAVLLIGYLFFDSWIEYLKRIKENEKNNNKKE